MSQEVKQAYLSSIAEEYRKSDRKQKSIILRHAMLVTGLTRKTIIKRLSCLRKAALGHSQAEPKAVRRPGRPVFYGSELLPVLKHLWLLMEQPCGKRMKVLLPVLLAAYRKRFQAKPSLTEEEEERLLKMSPSTIDRFLSQIKSNVHGLGTTRPPTSSWYKSAIPVQPHDWNITAPGYAQVDTVSHCGESASGEFASTLTLTDLDSHWTELRATLTKHHAGIIRSLRDIEQNLPFSLTTLKFDSGSEFMNYGVVSFLRGHGPSYGREKPIEVLRSRPYRKNDNCYVEQKNLTHVRQFVGYDRIESEQATKLLDEIYRELWCPFLNFFMPTFKLIKKERVGSKIKKKYDKPKTPYQRLMESQALSEDQKQMLQARYETLDPFELKEQIEEKLKLLMQLIRNEERNQEKPDESLKHAA